MAQAALTQRRVRSAVLRALEPGARAASPRGAVCRAARSAACAASAACSVRARSMDAAGGGALVPSAKRARLDGGDQQLVTSESRALASLEAGTVPRTSSLAAPIMKLTGHGDAVCSVKVSPNGAHLASGSVDKGVFLWNVRGDCEVRAAAAAQHDLKLPRAPCERRGGWTPRLPRLGR